MNRWLSIAVALVMGLTMSAEAQNTPLSKRRQGGTDAAGRNQRDAKEQARKNGPTRGTTDLRHHRFAPFRHRNDNRAFSLGQRDYRSWNRYSASRAQRFREGGSGGLYLDSHYRGGGSDLGGYGYLDAADYAEIHFNQSYYDDGPYGSGFYDRNLWYNWYVASHRAGQLLDINEQQVDAGMAYFHSRQYDRAAVAWLNASKANQGDAASRVYAGHALFALGRYGNAVRLLDRGFELAPRLATSQYDIRSDYANPADFELHLRALKTFVANHPDDAKAVTLLGYVLSHSEGPMAAYRVLRRAKKLDPTGGFTNRLWETARLVGDSPPLGIGPAPRGGVQPMQPAQGPAREPGHEKMRDVTGPKIKKVRMGGGGR